MTNRSICLKGMNQSWSPGNDFDNYIKYFKRYGLTVKNTFLPINQIVYLSDRYSAPSTKLHLLNNKLVFDYFHGDPKISPEFNEIFFKIKKNIHKFSRIRITNSNMQNLFYDHGIGYKTFKIYLGVETKVFKFYNNIKLEFKKKLNLNDDITIFGSFQKDSNGWNSSKTPKLIKGPDIFIDTLSKIYKKNSKIFVVLVGPEREYVKDQLNKLGIRYVHYVESNYYEVAKYYSLLDFLLITSREEGGPKALLEAMACGIPVISTPVGQAKDIIDNKNSFLSETFESLELAEIFFKNYKNNNLDEIKMNAVKTAKLHDFYKQKDLWKNFFSNL